MYARAARDHTGWQSMRIFTRTLAAGLGLLTSALSCGGTASAQAIWKFNSSGQPNTPFARHVERMNAEIAEETKGAIKFDIFFASQLGSEAETIQQVIRGRIEMGGFSLSTIALVLPEASILTIPFLFKDAAQFDCVVDSPEVSNSLIDALAAKGLHVLLRSALGTVHFVAKKPVVAPEDIRGQKARAALTKVGPLLWNTFGVNPIPLAITEWSSAHQTGMVDVSESPPSYYVISGLGKIAPVMSLSAHQQLAAFVLVSKSLFDKLPPEQKAAFAATRKRHPDVELSREMRAVENSYLDKHKEAGGQVVGLTAEQRAVWQKGIEPQFDKVVADVGGEAPKLYALVKTAITACRM
jgi:TRAP-type transport system periplasmic protein